MSAYGNLLIAVAKVVGGNQPDAAGKPYWYSGKDKGDGSGVSGLAGAWWPAPEIVQDTPVALILPGPGKLLQPFPHQGQKQIEDNIHVRVMVGHADLQTMLLMVVDFHDLVMSAFDTHMQLFGSTGVSSANCGPPQVLEVEWGGSSYAALEFVVKTVRMLPVSYQG